MPCVNILYVITKLELGGAQKQLLSLIRHLNKEKFRPFLFVAKEGLLIPEAYSIPALTIKKSRYLERPINPFLDLLALVELCSFIKKNKIELVHTHSSKAGILGRLAARLAGVKNIVHTVHGWSFNDCQDGLRRRLFVWLERLACGVDARLITVSYYDRDKGLANRIGQLSQYTLIRYGIDRENLSAEEGALRGDLGISSSDKVVVMVACLKPQKNPEDFLRLATLVLRDTPQAKFFLVGDGVLRRSLLRSIERLGLKDKVILLGWREDIPQLLSIADIFVLTSLWEGLPVSVLEALASARPVVATDTGGIREVVTERKNGFLVGRRDMERMSEAVNLLLNNDSLRTTMGKEAKESLGREFSVENATESTERFYAHMLTREGR